MPLPSPRKGQSRKAFLDSCLSDAIVNKEFPDTKQRYAVCISRYERAKKAAAYVISTATDEYIYDKDEIDETKAKNDEAKKLVGGWESQGLSVNEINKRLRDEGYSFRIL